MATFAQTPSSVEQRERLFFLCMAVLIAATVIPAFTLFRLAGLSSFTAPWWVHVHALTFMGWIGLYLVQNALVYRDQIGRHRRLGRFMAGWAVWMLIVGLVLTPVTLAAGRSPPFFTPAFFLALDWVNIVVFAGLLFAAIRLRRRTDWHRRLMLCATISVIAPAWGRLIILSGATMTAWNNVAVLLAYVVAAMAFDQLNRKRVHPAYLWGFGAILGMAAAIEGLAALAPFAALAASIAG